MTPEQNKLVTDNVRLVYYHFGKLRYNDFKNSHGDDFISEGMMGLVKAAKSFDPTKGVKFATYATRCINNEFFMYLRKLRRTDSPLISLDAPIESEGESLTVGDTEIMADDSMQKTIQRALKEEQLALFLKSRNETDNKVFALMKKGLTQKEVAAEMGISQSYVSRIFRKLKTNFANSKAKAT